MDTIRIIANSPIATESTPIASSLSCWVTAKPMRTTLQAFHITTSPSKLSSEKMSRYRKSEIDLLLASNRYKLVEFNYEHLSMVTNEPG